MGSNGVEFQKGVRMTLLSLVVKLNVNAYNGI
jgi:hypothetical protein